MPAPTAKKAELDFNSDPAIPLPEPEKDEELLLDAADLPDDPDMILQRVEDDTQNTEMVVDEEDRPRFAPGQDVVGLPDHQVSLKPRDPCRVARCRSKSFV